MRVSKNAHSSTVTLFAKFRSGSASRLGQAFAA